MSHEFTVCMVVTKHDDAKHFQEALSSILTQTLKPSEILLIDNGGLTPRHYQIIDRTKNEINTLLIALPNLNPIGKARNFALHHASFPIIAIADPDDINRPDRFRKLIPELNEKVRMIGSWIQEFSQTPCDRAIFRRVPSNFLEIVHYSKFRSPVNNPTLCYFKEDVIDLGGYNTSLSYGEDYDLAMRFIHNGKIIHNLPIVTVHFRMGERLAQKRCGLSLLNKEISLHRFFLKKKYISSWIFLKITTIKISVRLLPFKIFQIFYTEVLRKK